MDSPSDARSILPHRRLRPEGRDLKDHIHGGFVADWWGFTWMILAEARQVLTPEKRAAVWCRHGEKTWWA
jgi:hypothetical protein